MRILFLSRWFPYPIDNGSKLRIYNLLRGLSQYHEVTLISFADQPGVDSEASEVQEICSQVSVVPWKEFNPNTIHTRLAIFNLKPRSIVDTFSPEMSREISKTLKKHQYDLVIASQLQMAAYYSYFGNVPSIFEEFEIGLFYDQAFPADGKLRIRRALTWFKLRLYLSKLLDSYQGCTVVSEKERQLLLQSFHGYGNPIEIIPNCLNMGEYKHIEAEKKSNTLIFTGPFTYHVNYNAMLWFIDKVFPRILEQIPDAHLIITGDHANLPLPSTKNITLTGFVNDIKELLASSSICVAPLLEGGGTRLKILEAMALGTPVVATSKGAEGLDVRDGEHLLIADTPESFVDCVVAILMDAELRLKIKNKAYQLIINNYDWKNVMPHYLNYVEQVALKKEER